MLLALKAFFKALKDKEGAKRFIEGEKPQTPLKLLYLLQKSGRLVDFLQEDLSSFSDAQIGAAARKVQNDCQSGMKKWMTIKPLMTEKEGSEVTIPEHYDVASINVVGKVKGKAPYKGVLRHKGWRVVEENLPTTHAQNEIVCPAEVEIL